MGFDAFFRCAFGKADALPNGPFDYQTRIASEAWPDLLDVPTGMGKTAAVTLAWLWKRGWRQGERGGAIDDATPRRLIWCLPMRVLVEQTRDNIQTWLDNLGIRGNPGIGKVSVHVLMGGEEDLKTWAQYPEEDMILIGTQDMLLSRALMRGYGMSRYQWPIHFALLHNDGLWVFDEVQLMGAGLTTSAQLEAFRRSLKLAKSSRSLWVSATLNKQWLDTVDLRPHLSSLRPLGITKEDEAQAGDRLRAVKSLERATFTLDKAASNKDGLKAYLQALRQTVLGNHDANAQTLVIVNSVARAQQLFRLLQEHRENKHDLLIHARFRANERGEQIRRLHDEPATDRIIVATQAIEAGVDITSKLLVTELAPWPSLVQRFGRCNRYGEYNDSGARILWINVDDDADALPYSTETLAAARTKLTPLGSASARDLPPTDEAPPLTAVLRRKDLLDLFNTDPDLSGFDVDVADYIRDSGHPGVQVFWRDFQNDPNTPEIQGRPSRNELCPASLTQVNAFRKRKDVALWRWDSLDDRWIKLDRDPRPGMQLLARASDGGYDTAIGFDAAVSRPPVEPLPGNATTLARDYSGDWRSQQNTPVALTEHLAHVADHAAQLCGALDETTYLHQVVRAGRWHDLGKAHDVFQHSMYRCHLPVVPPLLAKSNCPGPMRHTRPYFRHELASMLGWLAQHEGEPDADLIAYLILAHHGKVRMSLRAMPDEYDKYPKHGKPTAKRFARGVWEGDTLPALDFDGEHSHETTLRLALMEIGEGEQGPSWTERSLRLLEQYGPFRLAWMETLVRLADWRASATEQLALAPELTQNDPHGLDTGHRTLAGVESGTTTADPSSATAAQSRAQHGVRGRASGSEDAGGRTRPPHAATRHLDTALGTLSYSELAPHLARRVEALQDAVDEGEFDSRAIDESLLRDFHQHICGELTPQFSGRWRDTDVIVGTHEPPPPFQLAEKMRGYVEDLNARVAALSPTPDELWLEALAFAEGRLLSIHPFADFNGRVTRVFIDFLARRLNLPDIDPTPDAGTDTGHYLDALHAADRNDWQPLMAIWRQRLRQGADQ